MDLVERHRPARKGLRHTIFTFFCIHSFVERHRPARKGLRHVKPEFGFWFLSCRKRSPCLKGIEVLFPLQYLVRLDRRKILPCSKGIETQILLCFRKYSYVERHRPARKGLRHACWIAIWLVFNRSKDIALFERDFVRIYFVEVKKTVKNLLIFDRTLFEEGINV